MTRAPQHAAPRARSAGFSLVEVLVALALTGLVMGALAMVTRAWLPNWKRGLDRVQQSELVALAVDRMAADLAAAEFVPADTKTPRPLFRGTPGTVTFVRTALGPNARPGLEIVELAPSGEGPDADFARRAAPYVPRPPDGDAAAFGPSALLLKAPLRVLFSYAGRDGAWRESWLAVEELPRAVRIAILDGRSGRALDLSTAVVIRAEVPASCVTDTARPKLCGTAPSVAQPRQEVSAQAAAEAGTQGGSGGLADGGAR